MATLASRTAPAVAHPDRFFIDGEWVAPSAGASFQVVTPSTEEVYLTVAEAQAQDMDRAIAAARRAFDHGPWPRMSHAERAAYLNAMGEALTARQAEIADMWTSEMGALRSLSGAMVPASIGAMHYYADLAENFVFEERHKPAVGHTGLLVREPVGVVAAIVPWNAPFKLIIYKIAPALLAGCTIVLKPSPEAPATALLMAEIAQAVGLPAGVLNVLVADRGVSERLVRSPDVDKVTFTGSSGAGRKIASICGERVARCTLELGGKSAAVVLEDYDVAAVARTLAQSTPVLTGQVCASLTRVIVPRNRHDALLDAMVAEFARLKVGDPFDPAIQMGPLATARQRDIVENYIGKGQADGAVLATGGKRPASLNRGFFIEPTVFGQVDNQMTIAREEIFGPVVSVIPAASEAQAIDIANDSPFGLNAAVFTNDPDRAYAAARNLRTGTIGQNGMRTDFTIAFGGFKQSGIGREGGVEGLLPFLETKTIVLDGPPMHLDS
ncbi:aldehyde dehydrogenase [Sphingobium amiense]|uniref:Aldehyde dehydrogenase n=1 Tax=Sphingobium amiense TaxID=135719 RepID=A0A494WCQ3_9SPHN|nr:aldehyde dehydrogenase [Sphingobium amiense]BBD98402.1 aldehyde dehydrogenase [Sphingobium amiense]